MFDTSMQDVVIARRPVDLQGNPSVVRHGMVLKDRETGQIRGHMVESFRGRIPAQGIFSAVTSVLSLGVSIATFAYMRNQFQALNRRLDRIEAKIDRIDEKLDILIGMTARVDGKVDAVAQALATLSGRIDARHRDMVFAEIGAVLDTLAYADRKGPAEARDMIFSNITGARKAIRLFENLIDDYEGALSPGDLGWVETIRMRLLSALVSVRIDLAMGDNEGALEKAQKVAGDVQHHCGALIGQWQDETPLACWIADPSTDALVGLAEMLESVDGIPPAARLASALVRRASQPAPGNNNVTNGRHVINPKAIVPLKKNESGSISGRSTLLEGVLPFKHAGLIFEWFKDIGDFVHAGDVIAAVEDRDGNDNRLIEIVSPLEGIMGEHIADVKKEGVSFRDHKYIDDGIYQPICRLFHGPSAEALSPPVQTQTTSARPGLMDAVESLAQLAATSRGMVAETALLLNAPEAVSALLQNAASPFSEDVILIDAAHAGTVP
ncbi:hypothetical protein [Insolitispirillum peregrinum]|uniref:hypothetical protein n=1 Tax=Insolitispirillum peregrinum TaxID=80876 RepID=UPI003606C678